MSEIRQYFQEEILPDGSVRRSFTDHFGDDLDAYILRHIEDQPDEQPEDVEEMLQLVEAGDEPQIATHVTLVDLADDGTIILEDDNDSDNDNGADGGGEND